MTRAGKMAALMAGLAVGMMLGGCLTQQVTDGAQYPLIRQARSADVHVLRDETEITLTNTSAAALPKGRMWINAWFSREFQGLEVGQSTTFDLYDFKDRFGVPFNGGGFFATRRPDKLVQAQIMSEGGELVGLIVIGE